MATYPTVHLNGTPRAALLKQAEDAYDAVQKAIEALAAMTPHGRDYYPQGNDAIGKALEEHRERVRKLRAVQDEIEDFAQHLWEGM